MADLNASNWSETDGSNNSTPPDGWPSVTMLPNQVEPAARAIMGALKRWYDKVTGAYTSTGASTHYIVTPSNNAYPTAYVKGDIWEFYADKDSAGADDFQISNASGLAAKPIYTLTQFGIIAITAGQIKANQFAWLQYDTALNGAAGGWYLMNPAPLSSSPSTTVNSTGGTVALTAAQARVPTLLVTGVLVSNLTITVPAGVSPWSWTVQNNTTGAFTVTVINAAGGTGSLAPQGYVTVLENDGTNISGIIAYLVTTYAPLASPALTGVPTTPTAALGTNTTQIASTAFVTQTAFSTALPAQPGGAIPYAPISTAGVVVWTPSSADTANFLAGII